MALRYGIQSKPLQCPYLSPWGPGGLGKVKWPEPGLKAQTEDSRWRRRGVDAALGRGQETSSSVKTSLVNYCSLPEVSNNQRGSTSWQFPAVHGRPRVRKGLGDIVHISGFTSRITEGKGEDISHPGSHGDEPDLAPRPPVTHWRCRRRHNGFCLQHN